MTKQEAAREAWRRWGNGSAVWAKIPGQKTVKVGCWKRAPEIGADIRGEGTTWEKAFADADERERTRA